MTKPLILHDPIFRTDIVAFRCLPHQQERVIRAVLPKTDIQYVREGIWADKDDADRMGWAVIRDRKPFTKGHIGLIWVNTDPAVQESQSRTFIHEAGHMAERVLMTWGAHGNPAGYNEMERLYQDWLVREAWRAWRW